MQEKQDLILAIFCKLMKTKYLSGICKVYLCMDIPHKERAAAIRGPTATGTS